MEVIEARHERELADLQLQVKDMLKKAKKAEKAVVQAQAVQMQFDLKAKHREEIEEFEENGFISTDSATSIQSVDDTKVPAIIEPEINNVEKKKEKAKMKKNKMAQKEQEREKIRNQIISSSSGIKSAREIEIEAIQRRLLSDKLSIKDIPSDGHCLYRAISDQLRLIGASPTYDFRQLRSLAAEHIRNNAPEYAPFLGFEASDEAFQQYCDKVQSEVLAEWGGQIEIRALSECLNRTIYIYCADTVHHILGISGEDSHSNGEIQPIRVSYHRHLFALGEHYNSVIPRSIINKS